MLQTQENTHSIIDGVDVRTASVVMLTAEAVPNDVQVDHLLPRPLLALNVSEAFLTAARRQRGLHIKAGHAARGSNLLLSLVMRAGRHVAMCLADLADPDVRAFASACHSDGRLPLLVRSTTRALVSTSRLSEETRTSWRSADGCSATSAMEFAGAMGQHLRMLVDDVFLQGQGVETRRLRSRTLLVHVPDFIEEGKHPKSLLH